MDTGATSSRGQQFIDSCCKERNACKACARPNVCFECTIRQAPAEHCRGCALVAARNANDARLFIERAARREAPDVLTLLTPAAAAEFLLELMTMDHKYSDAVLRGALAALDALPLDRANRVREIVSADADERRAHARETYARLLAPARAPAHTPAPWHATQLMHPQARRA